MMMLDVGQQKEKFLWTQRSHAVKTLIDNGADLDVQNESEQTPLMMVSCALTFPCGLMTLILLL